MAIGWDQALAVAALELDIPLHVYIPFKGQENMWPPKAINRYKDIVQKATVKNIVSTGKYAAWKMQTRNEAMADDCDILLALWDGSLGGTNNCILYGKKINKQIVNVWDLYTND
jgi:uncharacterized phage-like protein YoqJ